jgi:type VI secretion system protein ImpC
VPVSYKLSHGVGTLTGVLPFVIGVLADLSGKPDEPRPRLRDRRFITIDPDNFNAVMKGMKPRLAFRVDNQLDNDGTKLAVELRFTCMDDFGPERVVQQVEPLTRLLEVRRQLWALLANTDGNDRLLKRLQEILTDIELLKQVREEAGLETTGAGQGVPGGSSAARRTARAPAVPTAASQQEVTLLDQVITGTRVGQDEEQQHQTRLQIVTLIEEVMKGTLRVSKDLEATISARIANIDELLSRQLSVIMHAPDFQQLEASWRGLNYLVQQCEPRSHLHVKVLNVSKPDLLRDLERASEFDQSATFNKIYAYVST